MTNAQIIATLTSKALQTIEFRKTMGDTHAEALAYAKANSVAGSAVWAAVDAHYSGVTAQQVAGMDSTMAAL